MREDDMPPLQRAFLVPLSWAVACPCCGRQVDIDEVEQDDAGVYQGAREWCVVVCDKCDAAIDVQGVQIVERPGDPYFARRG